MKKEEILEELIRCEKTVSEVNNTLSKLKTELEKPESKIWVPKMGDRYYAVDYARNSIITWIWTNDDHDDYRLNHNNCFKTREEAEFALEKYKVLTELEMFAKEKNEEEIDWNNGNQKKYFINYNYGICDFKVGEAFSTRTQMSPYFTSSELTRVAICEFENRLRKYVYEVKV